MAKRMYVLTAYDYEDGSNHILATMDLDDKSRPTKDKARALREFLSGFYEAWLDGCDDEERRAEYMEEIKEAASQLTSKNAAADCCGDCLSWEEITNI